MPPKGDRREVVRKGVAGALHMTHSIERHVGLEPVSFEFQAETLPLNHLAVLSGELRWFPNYFFQIFAHSGTKLGKVSIPSNWILAY